MERYGAVVGGEALRSLLGFNTLGAFRQARVGGSLGVKVFQLPARRGHFALTEEVCAWLLAQREPVEES
ncbi:hypothetical protein EKH79_03135 [Dyella dinghuensis]|uniref:AlpA family phage regulatory protein n=1 Tax=Dyella dinghuensis TaxID=1920169 RepID=A0A3S0RGM5_9GAMM|nr:hypothetical protein EKH79_03135 [Dyella dinghuensis]